MKAIVSKDTIDMFTSLESTPLNTSLRTWGYNATKRCGNSRPIWPKNLARPLFKYICMLFSLLYNENLVIDVHTWIN